MNILIVTSNLSLRSGVASFLMNYLRNIDRNNNHFSLIYYDKACSPTYNDELIKLGISLFYIPRKSFISELNKFCKEHFGQFDLIHINDPYLSFCFVRIKKQLGVKKVVFHSHTTKFSDSFFKSIRNFLLSIPSRFIADAYFACSKKAGLTIFGRKFYKKGMVIYNALDLPKFYFNQRVRATLRKDLGIDNKCVIGHVGNMTPQKNHLFLLNVFFEYLKTNPDSVLLMVGDGYLKSSILKKAAKMNIDSNLIFAGVVSNPWDYYNAMDYFVFPSKFEGFGMALVEAQINGLNCLYSSVIPPEADLKPFVNCRKPLKEGFKKWAKSLLSLSKRSNCDCGTFFEAFNILLAAPVLIDTYQKIIGYEQKNKE